MTFASYLAWTRNLLYKEKVPLERPTADHSTLFQLISLFSRYHNEVV